MIDPSAPDAPVLRLGARTSPLARAQVDLVAGLLGARGSGSTFVGVTTTGDLDPRLLTEIGGTGVFANAVRDALRAGKIDCAVHSLKDLPTAPVEGLRIVALPEREDPRDALCARDGLTLAELPEGAAVGTGSPRRVAQLRALRPDLRIVDIRGNVGTRLNRVAPGDPGDLDAVVLAASGLKRLGLEGSITEYLDPHMMLPAPGQGALALEVSAQMDPAGPLMRGLEAVDHLPTRLAVTAERAVLAQLEAGCAAPVGTFARVAGDVLELDVVVANPDGSEVMRRSESVPAPSVEEAEAFGRRVADDLLSQGADRLARLSL